MVFKGTLTLVVGHFKLLCLEACGPVLLGWALYLFHFGAFTWHLIPIGLSVFSLSVSGYLRSYFASLMVSGR